MFAAIRQQARSISRQISRSLATEANDAGASTSTTMIPPRPIPRPSHRFPNPAAFLKAIGRSTEKKLKVDKWEELWKMSGMDMKKQGVSVQDRRYILWAMEKFRQGENPYDFSHEAKGKKKVRGRGPAVQNNKRIRSRRKQ